MSMVIIDLYYDVVIGIDSSSTLLCGMCGADPPDLRSSGSLITEGVFSNTEQVLASYRFFIEY